jgi:hypothetical protein
MENVTVKREYRVLERFDFTDAPPVPRNVHAKPKGKWAAVASRMRRIHKKNYGKWAKVATDVHFTLAPRMKKSFPDIAWTIRKNEQGKYDLWASYPVDFNKEDV